jgi:hypothetical protein
MEIFEFKNLACIWVVFNDECPNILKRFLAELRLLG